MKMPKMPPIPAYLKNIRSWHLRVVWRVALPLALWLAAPRLLPAAEAANVRDVTMTLIFAALLAWVNRNGHRGRIDARQGSGLLGHRPQDENEE